MLEAGARVGGKCCAEGAASHRMCLATRFTTLRISRLLARWRWAALALIFEDIISQQAASKLELRREIDKTHLEAEQEAAKAATDSALQARLESCALSAQ